MGLVLTRKRGESIIFKVTEPCEFSIAIAEVGRHGEANCKVLVNAPQCVDAVRSEIADQEPTEEQKRKRMLRKSA